MPKTITCPVERFAGTVTLAEPLTYPQALAVEDAIYNVQGLDRERVTFLQIHAAWERAILQCVESWQLKGMTEHPDRLPATPRLSAGKLATWLIDAIMEVYRDEEEIPNA